ncbi:hypothetical protein F5B19DRAFT_411918 [Rostrohypoxylon terebratum]|nr:hypothetical protein F5B19DRAFT_411918 [Rostrohypoxylon terebratum]
MQANNLKRPPHPSLRSSGEVSYAGSPMRRKSGRKHKDDAAQCYEPEVWSVTPKRKPVKSQYRLLLPGAYSDPGMDLSIGARDRARPTGMSGDPIFPSIKEAAEESRSQISSMDKHDAAVPPRAPRIPRLPTPDFSENEESYQFCSCCNGDDAHEEGCLQEEGAQSKMERQLHNAKAYIARKNSRVR